MDITRFNLRKERGGAIIVNYDYILTDELQRKKAGSGSIGVSQESVIPTQVETNLRQKLGYSGFTVKHPKDGYAERPVLRAKTA